MKRWHELEIEDGLYCCKVCAGVWRHRPSSRCPGMVWFPWDVAQAVGLATEAGLAREGLKLAPGQEAVGVALLSDGRRYRRLYVRDEAVPKWEERRGRGLHC